MRTIVQFSSTFTFSSFFSQVASENNKKRTFLFSSRAQPSNTFLPFFFLLLLLFLLLFSRSNTTHRERHIHIACARVDISFNWSLSFQKLRVREYMRLYSHYFIVCSRFLLKCMTHVFVSNFWVSQLKAYIHTGIVRMFVTIKAIAVVLLASLRINHFTLVYSLTHI